MAASIRSRSRARRQASGAGEARCDTPMRKPYPSDLTDEQWAIIEPLIPVHAV